MDKRVNSSSAAPMNKQQALKKLRAVEIMPSSSRTSQSSFITVHIGNCSVRVSDSTDLTLLKMISEAFDHD